VNPDEWSFQTRLALTILLCFGVVMMWPYLFPPTQPSAVEGDTSGGEVAAATSGDEGPSGADGGGSNSGNDSGNGAGKGEDPVAANPPVNPSTPANEQSATTHVVENELLRVTLTNVSGGLVSHVEPLDPQFREADGRGLDFLRLQGRRTFELGLRGDVELEKGIAREVVERSERAFAVRGVAGDLVITERFELLEGYEGTWTIELANGGAKTRAVNLVTTARLGESATPNSYDLHRALCRLDGSVVRWAMSDLDDGTRDRREGVITWTGVDTNYFVQAVVPGAPFRACELQAEGTNELLAASMVGPVVDVPAGGKVQTTLGVYVGPKLDHALAAFTPIEGAALDEAIYWGWFGSVSGFLGKQMLALMRWFHDLTRNWGLSIVLLTLVVKTLLFPLTIRQMRSMRKMREIQPELEALRKKYGGDMNKMAQEQQALFARAGVNPLAGCFPLLLQLPVFFALYAMLQAAVELYHEPFLWLPDLTQADPYFILPVALGGLTWLSTKLQPAAVDNEQARMMQWMMPIMLTAMMLFLPSGLTVYIFANTAIQIVVTLIMVRPGAPATPAAPAAT
jgi:YidC/Oxa1 family membrane protein insertase